MKRTKLLLIISFLTLFVSCDSRNIEKDPEHIKISGLSLEERIANKTRVDNALEQLEDGSRKIKRILDLVKKLNNSDENFLNYTPIDFLIDLNNEIKDKIPENDKNKLVRQSKIELPIKDLPLECQTVHAELSVKAIYADGTIQNDINEKLDKDIVGQQLTYSLKTCGTSDYLTAFSANIISSSVEFTIHKKNLVDLFKNILSDKFLADTNCKIEFGEKKLLQSIECQNIEAKLSSSEIAIIKTVSFFAEGDTRIEGYIDIYDELNKQVKATAELVLYKSGEVKFELTDKRKSDKEILSTKEISETVN